MNKVLKVRIAAVSEQRKRSLAIVAGARKRAKNDPCVWFPSVAAMARVLSDDNMALLRVIREQQPDSMNSLAKTVGKKAPNVSRSLHKMAEYGLVKFVKSGRSVKPRATFKHLSVDFF